MKKIKILILFCFSVTALQYAQNKTPLKDSTVVTTAISEQYIQWYLNLNFDALGTLMHQDFSFEDPTAAMLFGWNKPEGKENALAFFKTNYASITEMKADIIRKIISGNHAIYEMQLHFKFYQNEDKDLISISMPLITILAIKDGKVIEHKDYANYNDYIEQYRAQVKELNKSKE